MTWLVTQLAEKMVLHLPEQAGNDLRKVLAEYVRALETKSVIYEDDSVPRLGLFLCMGWIPSLLPLRT